MFREQGSGFRVQSARLDLGADRHGDECRAVVRRAGEEVPERCRPGKEFQLKLSGSEVDYKE